MKWVIPMKWDKVWSCRSAEDDVVGVCIPDLIRLELERRIEAYPGQLHKAVINQTISNWGGVVVEGVIYRARGKYRLERSDY
jgi:hypothetical protein